jgi:carbonic anhydrase
MNYRRSRILAVLLGFGVFCALPLFGTFQNSCHNPRCETCRFAPSTFISLAQAYSDEPKVASSRPPMTSEAKAALEKLIEGNQRFVANKSLNLHSSLEWRAKIVNEQKPFAAILGCADSRVPPEIVFDQGLGDLFVVRVAGNVVDPDVTGSLEYAGRHLGVRLFVVLGHEHCGAVSAVMAAEGDSNEPPGLQMLLERIEPAVAGVDPRLLMDKRIDAAVEANVRWSIEQLEESPRHKKAIDEGLISLIGAVYEMETGKVRILE